MRSILTTMLGVVFTLAAAGLAAGASPAQMPGTITLDAMAELFEGVTFDHAMHVEISDNCGVCHHHTVGTPAVAECASCHQTPRTDVAACRSCHSAQAFSAAYLQEKGQDRARYHVDKPGLKAAYHRNCLGCHEEMGGPMGCEDCHARTEAGDAFYHSGKFAPAPGQAAANAH